MPARTWLDAGSHERIARQGKSEPAFERRAIDRSLQLDLHVAHHGILRAIVEKQKRFDRRQRQRKHALEGFRQRRMLWQVGDRHQSSPGGLHDWTAYTVTAILHE